MAYLLSYALHIFYFLMEGLVKHTNLALEIKEVSDHSLH